MKNFVIILLIVILLSFAYIHGKTVDKIDRIKIFAYCYEHTRKSETFIKASGDQDEIYKELVAKSSCYDLIVKELIINL